MTDITNLEIDSMKLAELDRLLDAGQYLDSMKLVRSCTGWGLAESQKFLDVYDDNRNLELTKGILVSNGNSLSYDEEKESFSDFLKRNTRSEVDVERDRKAQEERRKRKQIERQLTIVCEEIKKKSFYLAQNGKRELNGVLRTLQQNSTGSFIEFPDREYLQIIKANIENDFHTSLYNYNDAQYVKQCLEEKLAALQINYSVSIESQLYYYYTNELKGGIFRSKTVRVKHWSGTKDRYVVIFTVKW